MRDSFGTLRAGASAPAPGQTTAAARDMAARQAAAFKQQHEQDNCVAKDWTKANGYDGVPEPPFITPAKSEVPFFTIWREFGASPTVKHFTLQSAEDEAARLSQANPGVKFYVMASLASAVTAYTTKPPVVFTRAY